jgi:hypothetical protein
MDPLPEEEIESAEEPVPPSHPHDGITALDETLRAHLVDAHGLDVPDHVSGSTAQGLHDRLHDRAKAADD